MHKYASTSAVATFTHPRSNLSKGGGWRPSGGDHAVARRLLAAREVTHVIVYWPDGALMPTTLAELVALRFLAGRFRLPSIWLLHHETVLSNLAGEFDVVVPEGRIAYLRDLARIGTRTVAWRDDEDLLRIVRRLSANRFDP